MARGRCFIALAIVAALIGTASPGSAREQYEFVTKWGSRDIYPGYFNWAPSLEVDRLGNVFVADQLNNRVQKFSSSGALLGYWGSGGAGPGQFNDPFGIAVDSTGHVYVADGWNFRVQVFTGTGGYLTQWGQQGSDEGDFYDLGGVAVDRFGYAYTVEGSGIGPDGTPGNNRTQRFTNTGAFIYKWPGVLDPTDVAVDRSGNIFVTDGHTVYKYASTGSYLTSWGNFGSGPGQFYWPQGLGVDRDGNVYVADTYNNRIQKFTGNGAYITQWGTLGSGDGQFRSPMDVAVDDSGSVYVTDTENYRIQKFRQRTPNVLLVHGVCGDSTAWNLFAQILTDSGYVVHRYQYGSHDYNLRPAAYVNGLAAKLDAMQADHVAVIAHSMGGLITREYMRRQINAGKHNPISQLITLGTPHHGSDLLAKILDIGTKLDDACRRLPFHPDCHPFNLVSPLIDHCLGNPYSRPALLDMVPGSPFLNQLNYAEFDVLFDGPSSHGWSPHQSEINLASGVYHASIGGTGSFCWDKLREYVWDKGANYHPNDGTVAAGSAILTGTSAFRAQDLQIPVDAVAHTPAGPTNCHLAYYTSAELGRKLATLLANSPTTPPVQEPDALTPVRDVLEAAPQDSLRSLPAIVATLAAHDSAAHPVSIGATTLLRVTLFSTDAHLSLERPDGSRITANDSSTANGIAYFATPDAGFEGFEITAPLAGTWILHVDGSASIAEQDYGALVEVSSPLVPQVSLYSNLIRPYDAIRVRAQIDDGGTLRTDLTWSCNIIGPDDSVTPLDLYDDGAHSDGQPGDGIYANDLFPEAGAGDYRIAALADVPGAGSFTGSASCELIPWIDLAVRPEDIWFSTNLPQADDSISIYVQIRNQSTVPSNGIEYTVRDLAVGSVLQSGTVDIDAYGTTVVQVPWRPSLPDSHRIELSVSPYQVDELDFSNNSTSKQVVLGTTVSVHPWLPTTFGMRFDAPRPNPTTGAVAFAFTLPRTGAATLEIYDVRGRRIRSWSWKELEAGPHTAGWDGRDRGGALAGPGLYLCRLTANGHSVQQKLVVRR